MSTISIKKEMISWARERAGLKIDDLLKPFPKFAEWEQGISFPTLRQLENFARRVYAPLGYFFLPDPPEEKLPIPDFRSVGDIEIERPSPDLLETIFSMQRRQAWYKDFIIEEGYEPLAFVGSVTMRDKPENIAKAMRDALGMTRAWANSVSTWTDALVKLKLQVEQAGVLTVWNGIVGNNTHRKLNVNEFRGFVLSDSYAPLIFINTVDAKAAQMFTLAHELAHIWINSAGVLNFRQLEPADNNTERFCSKVAAEFLIPKDELSVAWSNLKHQETPFDKLARQFKVSPLVAARRVLDEGYIAKERFFEFYKECMDKFRRFNEEKKAAKSGGGDFYLNCDNRIGRPFTEAIIRATQEGKLLYRDAYQLTGLQGTTFDKYVQKIIAGIV